MTKIIATSSHGSGPTCMTFSRDGTRAYTGGQDCIVRIWKTDEGIEQEPDVADDAEGPVTSVAAADDCWLSGSEDAEVRRYLKNKNQLESVLTSTNVAHVRCVVVNPKGRKAAVCSADVLVKVIDMDDPLIVQRLDGHAKGVRRATWHPTEDILTTCGDDGTILVWSTFPAQPTVLKSLPGLIPAVSDEEAPEFAHDCSAVWHPSGNYFFIPSVNREIISISHSDWSRIASYTDSQLSGPITALALSPNGVYLAAASQAKILIWSTQTRRVVVSRDKQPGVTITHLAFSPKDNLLAWTDTEGVFSRWRNVIPDTLPNPVRFAASANTNISTAVKPPSDLNLFADSLATEKMDMALDGDDVEDNFGFGEDYNIDDVDLDAEADELPVGKNEFVKEMVSITRAQPSFQPGSTPMENKKRYLAHNLIGVIELTDQDTHYIINVEFFDRSARKSYHFSAYQKYDIGYLGECGAVFACQHEDDHPATVHFKPYGTWNSSEREWSYQLPAKGCKVLGVAAGGVPISKSARQNGDRALQGLGNVVVATSEDDLTFLSGTGRERRILGLGAEFVSMVAGPEWVFVVYRAGSTTIDGSQQLSYCIISFEDFSIRQCGVLPLPKGHTLKWIGITEQGCPSVYDSAERVHILTKHRIPHHGSWTRIMDLKQAERRQGKDESYWPVGIDQSMFMCLILKGRQEHPGFPRPIIQEVPMRMPFRIMTEPKFEQIERDFLHLQNACDMLDEELTTDDIVAKERAMDKDIIILIQTAAKADDMHRAIELTKLLHHLAAFDMAVKIAEFYHHSGLKEKLLAIKADREEAEDRLVAARNKRRRWLKPDPPIRELVSVGHGGAQSRLDPLSDTRPPPATSRPGLARVTVPVIEQSPFSSKALSTSSSLLENHEIPPSSWEKETSLAPLPPPVQDGKRKRIVTEEAVDSDLTSMVPHKSSGILETSIIARNTAGLNRNPFARKSEPNRTIHKSESFFDKVDAAENGTRTMKSIRGSTKGKEKAPERERDVGKKDIARQTTLFGMMGPKAAGSTPMKGAQSADTIADDRSTEPEDVSMSETATLFDNQTQSQAGESQSLVMSEWETTQVEDGRMDKTDMETQLTG